MTNVTVGLDIAKNVFHAVFVTSRGKITRKKQLKRAATLPFFAKLTPQVIAIEACGASNHLARELIKLGHDVKLVPPQHVTSYRRKNKNDYNDAEAIAEAAQRDNMTFVPVKTIDQQDAQMYLRIRQRLIKQRTQLMNQIRGLLLEYGLCVNRGISALRRTVPELLEDPNNELTWVARELFNELSQEFIVLDERIEQLETKLKAFAKENHICQIAQSVVGIGPITALALYAAIGSGTQFKSGRHFSAWCGLVPRQYSTGGKSQLYGITKKGNVVIRALLVHGARSALQYADKKNDRVSVWATKLKHEKSFNKACVALANKLARIVWAVITHNKQYELKEA